MPSNPNDSHTLDGIGQVLSIPFTIHLDSCQELQWYGCGDHTTGPSMPYCMVTVCSPTTVAFKLLVYIASDFLVLLLSSSISIFTIFSHNIDIFIFEEHCL